MNYTIQNKNFDTRRTFLCGQCFRWSEDETGAFSGIAGGRSLTVTQSGDEVTLHGVSEQDIPFWENYFDLGTDYSAYIETLSAGRNAEKSLRILAGHTHSAAGASSETLHQLYYQPEQQYSANLRDNRAAVRELRNSGGRGIRIPDGSAAFRDSSRRISRRFGRDSARATYATRWRR